MSTNARSQPRQPKGVPVGGQWRATVRPEGTTSLSEPRVTRSAGAVVNGLVVGGGYHGATAKLDRAADEAASAMALRFGNVEIRFNSDRRSGGAWLVTHPGDQALSANTWVGIRTVQALSRTEAETDWRLRKIYGRDETRWAEYLECCDEKVHLSVYVARQALRDPSLVGNGMGRYEAEVPDVDAAVALIERVSVAGDPAEIARRRELAAELGNELAELKAEIEKRLSPAWRSAQKAGDKAAEKEVRAQARAELERGTARLQERFWAEAARG